MEERFYRSQIECMPAEQKKKLQDEKLKKLVRLVYERQPAYRKKMDEAGVAPEDIHGTEDMAKLPFTEKKDMTENYPFGLLTVPMEEVARIHGSSGTTGKMTVVGCTQNDLDVFVECVARGYWGCGVRRHSIVQNAHGYGMFIGGLGAHYAAERLGAAVVPMGVGNTRRQVQLLKDFQADTLICTPSYALKIAREMREEGIAAEELGLRRGIFAGEASSEELRKTIERELHIKAYDVYGLSEITNVCVSCGVGEGMHVPDDHLLAEIIDPVTLRPLPAGEIGEIVFTTLSKTGMPLVRYRTRDLSVLLTEPCACGRTSVRLGRILGRTDDMLVIRGINVFPSQIESLLLCEPRLNGEYCLVAERRQELDTLCVRAELKEAEEEAGMCSLRARLQEELHSLAGLHCEVELYLPHTMPAVNGREKVKRVLDLRKI